VINLRTSIKPLTVAITSAILFASLSGHAVITEPANEIKMNYPLGNMEVWLAAPDDYALNPVNIRAGKHPDRSDPNDGPYDVIYIFPNELDANSWWNGIGIPPDGIPEKAVAFVHWELDNGSGTFPGIMGRTDVDVSVDNFKSRNCIMAAGATIPQKGVPDGITKDCNNPQGTSKRFKMNVLIPDVPVDLQYNVQKKDLTFNNTEDNLPTFDGTEEAGRIYRVLQKWHNASGMDTAAEIRDGKRIVGFRLELGYGVGGAFTPITGAAGIGTLPDKTLGFEMRPCMPDAFFDVSRGQPGAPKNVCANIFDTADQKLPQEIWLEEEYGTYSPKQYSFVDDKRMVGIGIPGGFWDKRPAGNYPPETQTLGKIDSGEAASDSLTYFDPDRRVDGATALPGYIGATTPNYFDLKKSQAADATDLDNINNPPPFGYLMYFGVLADKSYGDYGDSGNLAQGIYRDEDGDPASEGDMIAWWDGDQYRWGVDGEVFDGIVTPEEKFAAVDINLLKEWALYPLLEEPNTELYPDTGFPPGPLYEAGILDDLAGLNIDYWVYLGRELNYDADVNPTFTIRLTAVSTGPQGANIPDNDYGNDTQAWVDTPAPALSTLIDADGIINITEPAYAGEPLNIVLGDADASPTGAAPTVALKNDDTGETEDIILVPDADPALNWRYDATIPTVAEPTAGANNDGTLNVWPGQTVTVTYVDAYIGDIHPDPADNVDVTKTDSVIIESVPVVPVLAQCEDGIDNDADGLIDFPADPGCIDALDDDETDSTPPPPPPPSDDSNGCSCSHSPDGSVDPILPAVVLFALGYLGLRRREERNK